MLTSWFVCVFFFLRCFNILCYASGFYMLLFVVRCLWCARARARVCVFHWHCSAQLSMFNMEKRYRNKIIIIIIIIITSEADARTDSPSCSCCHSSNFIPVLWELYIVLSWVRVLAGPVCVHIHSVTWTINSLSFASKLGKCHITNTQHTPSLKLLFVGCLTSQQQASVSQGRICSDNFMCCHTEIEAADQTFYLTQSQYTDIGPTSPSADTVMPGAWQGSNWSANY